MSRQSLALPNTFAGAPGPPSAEPMVDLDQNFTAVLNGLLDSSNGYVNSIADTGSANVYIATLPTAIAPTGYANGMTVAFLVSNSNTGSSTLNVNSLGSVPILLGNGNPVSASALASGSVVLVVYYNGNFYLMSAPAIAVLNQDLGNVSASSSTVNCNGFTEVNISVNYTGSGAYTLNLTNLSIGTEITWNGTNGAGGGRQFLMTASLAPFSIFLTTIIAYQMQSPTSAVNRVNLITGTNAIIVSGNSFMYSGIIMNLATVPQLYMLGGQG